jgi:hypothetical protein
MDVWVDSADLDPFAAAMAAAPALLDREMQVSRDAALLEGIGYAVDFAPVGETGSLAGSIHVLSQDGWGGRYGTDLIYAWQREEGGTIYGNPYLVFEWNGRLIFARQVTQEGDHYMQKSADALEPRLDAIYGRGVERVLASL